jgi:hypothetical protein
VPAYVVGAIMQWPYQSIVRARKSSWYNDL